MAFAALLVGGGVCTADRGMGFILHEGVGGRVIPRERNSQPSRERGCLETACSEVVSFEGTLAGKRGIRWPWLLSKKTCGFSFASCGIRIMY